MMYKKVQGIFRSLPLEAFTIEWLCKHTNSSKKKVQPVLNKLVKQDIIVNEGIAYYLKEVPKHIRDIPK